jgi:hypothetical protein
MSSKEEIFYNNIDHRLKRENDNCNCDLIADIFVPQMIEIRISSFEYLVCEFVIHMLHCIYSNNDRQYDHIDTKTNENCETDKAIFISFCVIPNHGYQRLHNRVEKCVVYDYNH